MSLGADKHKVTVTAAVADAKAKCAVNGQNTKLQVSLNVSFTKVTIDVTSPDGSAKAVSLKDYNAENIGFKIVYLFCRCTRLSSVRSRYLALFVSSMQRPHGSSSVRYH